MADEKTPELPESSPFENAVMGCNFPCRLDAVHGVAVPAAHCGQHLRPATAGAAFLW